MEPVRKPRSSEHNRHVPVTAYSITNAAHIALESGLEHDLLRKVDRDPRAARIVAQPFRLSWTEPSSGWHTPDLLVGYADGRVAVWDARSAENQDDDFRSKAAVTARACATVGWTYEVFTGLGEIERLNLLWLHGFRQAPEWWARYEDQIQTAVGTPGQTLGELFALDDGTGELKAVIWHLIWRGVLGVDLTAPLTEHSMVGAGGSATHA